MEKRHGKGTFVSIRPVHEQWLGKICTFSETIERAGMKPGAKLLSKVIIQSVRPAGELFFHHCFFVTNFEVASPQEIVLAYRKRGTMENYIKEAKEKWLFHGQND